MPGSQSAVLPFSFVVCLLLECGVLWWVFLFSFGAKFFVVKCDVIWLVLAPCITPLTAAGVNNVRCNYCLVGPSCVAICCLREINSSCRLFCCSLIFWNVFCNACHSARGIVMRSVGGARFFPLFQSFLYALCEVFSIIVAILLSSCRCSLDLCSGYAPCLCYFRCYRPFYYLYLRFLVRSVGHCRGL